MSSLRFGVFLSRSVVSLPAPSFHPHSFWEAPGDVPKDPLALCPCFSDREAASVSQPEPGIAEFRSFSDTGFLWDLSFPVTLRRHVWEQEGAGHSFLEEAQRLRAHALPHWAVPTAVTPPALTPLPATRSLGSHRSWWQVGEPLATWTARSAGVHGKGLVGHKRGHPACISLFLRQELVAPI